MNLLRKLYVPILLPFVSKQILIQFYKFKARYIEMYGDAARRPQPLKSRSSKLAVLLAENSSDEDSVVESAIAPASSPWSSEFNQYLNSVEEVPQGMTLARWWGVRHDSSLLLTPGR